MKPEVGQDIYVNSSFHISHGSEDVVGGLAKVTKVERDTSGGKEIWAVSVAEHPGILYNWCGHLEPQQEELKKEFGDKRAYPDPDVDTPWIDEGDIVNGQEYHGDPII